MFDEAGLVRTVLLAACLAVILLMCALWISELPFVTDILSLGSNPTDLGDSEAEDEPNDLEDENDLSDESESDPEIVVTTSNPISQCSPRASHHLASDLPTPLRV